MPPNAVWVYSACMFDPENDEFAGRQFENRRADEEPEEDVSLEGLSEAFAEAMGRSSEAGRADEPCAAGRHDDAAVADDAASDETAEPLPSSYGDETEEDDPCPINPGTILESMLFVGNVENLPLTSRRAAELMRGVEAEEIPELVERLNARYAADGCPYRIFSEGSGYRLRLHERFHALRNKFYGRVREARLSQATIDVLAIVAYRQPITADEVNRLRDKPCGHLLAQLVRRRLLRIERPEDKASKPLYSTTERFLELFGMESIADLPQSEGA